jgi:hypothetical protein
MNYEWREAVIAGLTRNPLIKITAVGQGIPRQVRDDKDRHPVRDASLGRLFHVLCLMSYLFLASCAIDNYEAPTGGLFGQIVDAETGEPVPQSVPSDWGLRLRFYEADRENALEQHFYAQEDGSFKNTHLFNGPIRLVLEQRNFFPIDTIDLLIEGQTKRDIAVIPYACIRVENLQLTRIDFTISRNKNRSYNRHRLTHCHLLWHVSPHIDIQPVNHLGKISVELSDEAEALNRLHTMAPDLFGDAGRKALRENAAIIQGNGNLIYVRLCVVTEDENENEFYANYSPVFLVEITDSLYSIVEAPNLIGEAHNPIREAPNSIGKIHNSIIQCNLHFIIPK